MSLYVYSAKIINIYHIYKKTEIARNLIKLVLSDETIQAATQLSLQIISELRMRVSSP